jgi:hypothetical protein
VDLTKVLTVTFWVVVIASFPAILWFFKVRRVMIRKQVMIIRSLEKVLKPRDKRYWLLGYLVGFRAKYWINRGGIKRAWALYVTPPHHVFFYIPFIVLFKKRERLELTLELDASYRMKGEAHLFNTSERSTVRNVYRDVRDLKTFKSEPMVQADGDFKIIYRGDALALNSVRELFHRLKSKQNLDIYRISLDETKKVIHVSFNPRSQEEISTVVSTLLDYIKTLRARP